MSRVGEQTCWESRRHAIVLAAPCSRAVVLGVAGLVALGAGWPFMLGAPVVLTLGALHAALAAWRWERTRVVLTTEKLFVIHGTLRRRAAAVRLSRVAAIEVEQTLVGRLFGYGTLVAGDLEIPFVPQPRDVGALVGRLSA